MFSPLQTPSLPQEGPAWILLFDGTELIVDPETGLIPVLKPSQAKDLTRNGLHPFGTLNGMPCCCGTLTDHPPESGLTGSNLRDFYQSAHEDIRLAIAYGRFVADVHTNNHFCGRCGTLTQMMKREHGRACPACGLHAYPRISPAVIMGVTRGDEILLARGTRFPKRQMFSVLAGFTSPGETLEASVAREVYEETRIRVTNIRYVKSQPWPFPDSLMIGFMADYESGEIEIDPTEIIEAGWFKADRLPIIPSTYSLSGQLIRQFRMQFNK